MDVLKSRGAPWIFLSLAFFIFNLAHIVFWSFQSSVSPLAYLVLFPFLIWGLIKDPVNGFITCALFGLFILLILGTPLFDWDAKYIWFFHAKRIFLDNNLYTQLDDYFSPSHNDYPVLVPAIAASYAKSIGYWNEVYPRLSVLFVIFPVFVGMQVLLKKPALYGLWISGVLIASGKYLINGYMDAILGITVGLACCSLIQFYGEKKENRSYWFLAVILFTLPHIKNEGLLASLLIVLAMTPKILTTRRYWALPLLSFVFYYFIWKRPVTLAGIVTTDLFVPGITTRFLNRMTSSAELYELVRSIASISAIYFFILCLFVWFPRIPFKKWAPAFFVVAGYSAAMFVIYLITALDLKVHLQHSVDRTFLVVNLSIISMLVFQAQSVNQSESKLRLPPHELVQTPSL